VSVRDDSTAAGEGDGDTEEAGDAPGPGDARDPPGSDDARSWPRTLAVLVRRSALDPVRAGDGYVTVVLFALLAGLFAYTQGPRDGVGFAAVVGVVAGVAPFLVVVRCADALAADRESGRLRGLLALPFTRRQVVVGTLLGRLAWFVAAALGALVLGLVVFALRGGSVDPATTLVAVVLLCVQLVVYVGVAVGVSAAVATTPRAGVVASALWRVTQLFWSQLPGLVSYLLNGLQGAGRPPWADTFVALGPLGAFQTLSDAFVAGQEVTPVLGGEPWSALLVLLAWFLAPLAFGLRRFERATL
jgi:ABC-2 type transport system permease protein